MNFIKNAFRGNLSLAVTFWVICIAIPLFLEAVGILLVVFGIPHLPASLGHKLDQLSTQSFLHLVFAFCGLATGIAILYYLFATIALWRCSQKSTSKWRWACWIVMIPVIASLGQIAIGLLTS